MRHFSDATPGRTIFVDFDAGELLLEGIQEVIRMEVCIQTVPGLRLGRRRNPQSGLIEIREREE